MTSLACSRHVLALTMAALLACGPALADKDRGQGDDGGKHGQKHHDKHQAKAEKRADKHQHDDHDEVRAGAYFNEGHRHGARTYYASHYGNGKGCPSGLARKNNGCLPPGQAGRWTVGQPLPREVIHYPVPQPVILRLPVAPVGYRYVRVGNDILLLSPQSAVVMDAIRGILG